MESLDIDRKYKDDKTLNLTEDEEFEIFKKIADKVPIVEFSQYALMAIGKAMDESHAGEFELKYNCVLGGKHYNLKMIITKEEIENTLLKI